MRRPINRKKEIRPSLSLVNALAKASFLWESSKYRTYSCFTSSFPGNSSAQVISSSPVLYCRQLASIIIENTGDFKFNTHDLPKDVQFSRISGVIATDINLDGEKDLVMAGNFSPYRVQLGPCDASVGLVLKQTGLFQFESMEPSDTGFWATGDIRYMLPIDSKRIVVTVNNGEPLIFNQTVPKK